MVRWDCSEVAGWETWKGSAVARWEGRKVMRWEGGRFLVLFRCGRHRVSPRFPHPFLRVTATSHFNKTRNTKTNCSTRWTGQTRVTNSQVATRESWLVRCSPRAPGFTRSNQHNINHGRQPILLS